MTGPVQANSFVRMESRPKDFVHEMNNCLMSISGFAELILTAKEDDPQLKFYAEKIFRQSRRGFGLMQELKEKE